MSKSNKSQLLYLLRILECCGKIEKYIGASESAADFFKKEDQAFFNAALTLLVQIAEQSKKLEKSLKEKMKDIPWQSVKGFRNLAVHEYEYVEREKVFEIVTTSIPELKTTIENFILHAIKEGGLSAFELNLSLGSEFYTHVRFDKLLA